MKFDRSMTEYNEIVGASIYRLLGGGEAEKLHKANPVLSAAVLILKENHGTAYHGCAGPDGIGVKSTPQGMEVDLSHFFPDIDDKTLILSWSDAAKLIKDDSFYAEYIHAYKPAKTSPSEQPKEQPPAETDFRRAKELSQRIQIAAEMAQANLWDMCCALKEMRDSKLYKALGYANFEDYCENEHGIKKVQAYKYIAVAEKYTSEKNVHSSEHFFQLGINKLYLLSTLDEEQRNVLAESTDLENTTVKALERQIKELTKAKDTSEMKLDELNRNNINLAKSRNEIAEKCVRLEQKVKDLESRPVEVATQVVEKIPDDCITRRAYEEMVTNYTNQLAKADEESLAEKRRAYEEKQQLEQKIAELENGTQSNPEDEFQLLCQICRHPLSRLALFVGKHPLYKSRLDGFIAENTAISKEEK